MTSLSLEYSLDKFNLFLVCYICRVCVAEFYVLILCFYVILIQFLCFMQKKKFIFFIVDKLLGSFMIRQHLIKIDIISPILTQIF